MTLPRNALVVLLATGASLSGACGQAPDRSGEGVTVVTTFRALSTIVSPLLGPGDTVHVLLPAGASPHAYEPRPSDMRILSGAHLVFRAGGDVDGWVARLVPVATVSLMDLVPDSFGSPSAATPDLHIWLDPEAIAAALPNLATALCDVHPANCSEYRERARSFASSMPALVDRIRVLTDPIRDMEVVTSGPFLGWWSNRFGPRIAGCIETIEGVEPSASRMNDMIQTARGSVAVVGQAALPSGTARAVAEAAAVPYVSIDIVGTPDHAADYAGFLLSIAEALPKP